MILKVLFQQQLTVPNAFIYFSKYGRKKRRYADISLNFVLDILLFHGTIKKRLQLTDIIGEIVP